ncbi:MAG: type II toxin-antitoxin system MqsA family antitoxin [Candidatus Bipolaricaulota bacterium]|nr:type II toxin-antitoxin system MqsA family antitoxin [Candidatus Bipolaricaulota bacterium]
MRCAVCGGAVRLQNVQEELIIGSDHYMVSVRAEVCQSCGERYFSERTTAKLVQLQEAIQQGRIKGEVIGRVYEVAK